MEKAVRELRIHVGRGCTRLRVLTKKNRKCDENEIRLIRECLRTCVSQLRNLTTSFGEHEVLGQSCIVCKSDCLYGYFCPLHMALFLGVEMKDAHGQCSLYTTVEFLSGQPIDSVSGVAQFIRPARTVANCRVDLDGMAVATEIIPAHTLLES